MTRIASALYTLWDGSRTLSLTGVLSQCGVVVLVVVSVLWPSKWWRCPWHHSEKALLKIVQECKVGC